MTDSGSSLSSHAVKKYFSPADFLVSKGSAPQDGLGFDKTVLVILNMPIVSVKSVKPFKDPETGEELDIFETAWNNCKYRVCADGGANRLYDFFKHDKAKRAKYLPDFIAGDMDSAKPKVLKFYEQHGVHIKKDSDQYSTDLMKCVKIAQDKWFLGEGFGPSGAAFKVIALGALGGRVDQSFHSINNLYTTNLLSLPADENENTKDTKEKSEEDKLYEKYKATLPHEFILLAVENSSATLTFLLPSNPSPSKKIVSVIDTPTLYLGPAVGILPVQGLTHITTHGLQWDVTNWETVFGGHVSTSNYLKSEQVQVEAGERPVVFTIDIQLLEEESESEAED